MSLLFATSQLISANVFPSPSLCKNTSGKPFSFFLAFPSPHFRCDAPKHRNSEMETGPIASCLGLSCASWMGGGGGALLLQWFLVRRLRAVFEKKNCWSRRNIDRRWARRGLWLWHIKVIFLPAATSPPLRLSWALKIAHRGQYTIPTVTMSAIKNAWSSNVKHDKGQRDDTGLGCKASADTFLQRWSMERISLSL